MLSPHLFQNGKHSKIHLNHQNKTTSVVIIVNVIIISFIPHHNDVANDYDIEKLLRPDQQGELKRELKNRHVQMIALGGSVGTGLLIGSGGALHQGGPAALLIAWG